MLNSRVTLALIALAVSTCVRAQESIDIDDLARSAQEWAAENLDEDFLRVLGGNDRQKTEEFLRKLQEEFHGEYVIDLAQLRDTARAVLPLLDQYEETQPYAIWLRERLDYLQVAEELRVLISPPKPKPGEAPRVVSAPKLREIWIKQLRERPWPERSKPYVARLKPIFAAEKVPPELVWIAEAESSFDPRARSPAGAAGLFQLMPVTAKEYGLRTWPLDQRLKPDPSARAAAQHLQRLYARYKDWRLALAAYNAGQGTVDTLLKRYKARTYDGISSHLPSETQMYVPKVEGILLRREGLTLAQLKPEKAR